MKSRFWGALSIALLSTVSLVAQMTNSAQGALTINGVTGASPLEAVLEPGQSLNLAVTGNANVPWVLGFAPDISINETVFAPGLALDIGPYANVVVLMDGTASPAANFWNAFANTGPSGVSSLTFPLPLSLTPGPIGALQAFLIDFTLPSLVKATAATRLSIHDSAPDLLFTATAASGLTDDVSVLEPGVGVHSVASPASVQFQDIGLRRHGILEKNEGTTLTAGPAPLLVAGGFYRRRPPTLNEPRFHAENTPHVRTVFGDVYGILDTTTNLYGYMIVDGVTPRVLTHTMRPAVAGANPWKVVIGIDGPVMAAVETVAGGPDKIDLILLDQTVWSQTGTETRDVTPTANVPQQIAAESLILQNGVLFFTGTITGGEPLYRVDLFSTQTATQVTLPILQNSALPNFCSREGFADPAHGAIWLRVADVTTAGASSIFRLTNIAPGTAATITTIVALSFASNQSVIEEFGRAHDGDTGRLAISPDGQRVAFVVRHSISTLQDVMIRDIAAATTTTVTTSAHFTKTNTKAIDLTFATNNRLLFWFGISALNMDLYAYDIATDVVTNVTNTNGVGSTAPIFVGSGSRINPNGQVQLADRLIFVRTGLASAGANFNFNVKNIISVDLSSLLVTNMTGDEFPGATTTPLRSYAYAFSPAYAESGSIIWFAGTRNGTAPEIFSYDTVGAFVPATPHVISTVSSNCRLGHFEPLRDGSGCRWSESFQNTNGGYGIFEVLHAGVKSLIVPAVLAEEYFDIVNFPANAPHDGFYVVRTFSNTTAMLPSVQNVRAYDAVTQQFTDATPAVTSAAQGFNIRLLAVKMP